MPLKLEPVLGIYTYTAQCVEPRPIQSTVFSGDLQKEPNAFPSDARSPLNVSELWLSSPGTAERWFAGLKRTKSWATSA